VKSEFYEPLNTRPPLISICLGSKYSTESFLLRDLERIKIRIL